MFLGLRTIIYQVSDLDVAKAWYSKVLGIDPYFDEPFYVGFNVGGYELGLDPDVSNSETGKSSVVAYWGVEDVTAEFERLVKLGAAKHSDVQNVGGDIKVATVLDPSGNIFGIIENPLFSLESN
jgi:predicted enzyme related to lactoylglutathione lyase